MKLSLAQYLAGLRRYLASACSKKAVPKSEILSSDTALRGFGRLWTFHKADLMAMAAVVEHEYRSGHGYTESEIGAVKKTLGEVILFFMGCEAEVSEIERARTMENARARGGK